MGLRWGIFACGPRRSPDGARARVGRSGRRASEPRARTRAKPETRNSDGQTGNNSQHSTLESRDAAAQGWGLGERHELFRVGASCLGWCYLRVKLISTAYPSISRPNRNSSFIVNTVHCDIPHITYITRHSHDIYALHIHESLGKSVSRRYGQHNPQRNPTRCRNVARTRLHDASTTGTRGCSHKAPRVRFSPRPCHR